MNDLQRRKIVHAQVAMERSKLTPVCREMLRKQAETALGLVRNPDVDRETGGAARSLEARSGAYRQVVHLEDEVRLSRCGGGVFDADALAALKERYGVALERPVSGVEL